MLRATLARRSKMLPPSGGPNLHNPLPVPIEQLPWFSKLMLGRNNVLENQRKWQQDSHIPTYLRGNGKYYYRESHHRGG